MDSDKYLFKAMHIIDKAAESIDKEPDRIVDIVYLEDAMCINGDQWVSYNDGTKWYTGKGLLNCFGTQILQHVNTENYIFVTDGIDFEYYTPTDELGEEKCINSIHAAFIAMTKLYMDCCDECAIVSTSDCSDFILVRNDITTKNDREYTISGKNTTNFLVKLLTNIITFSTIRKLIDLSRSGKIYSVEDAYNWVKANTTERITAKDIEFISLITSTDITELTARKIISTIKSIAGID